MLYFGATGTPVLGENRYLNITDQVNVKTITSAPPNHVVHNAKWDLRSDLLICSVLVFVGDPIIY